MFRGMSTKPPSRIFSLKWRIIGLAFSAVVALTVAFCAGTYVVVSKTFARQSITEIRARIGAIDHMLKEAGARQVDAALPFAANPELIDALRNRDGQAAGDIARRFAQMLSLGEVLVIDGSGVVVGSSGSSGRSGEVPGAKMALAGRIGSGFVADAGGGFPLYSAVPVRDDDHVVGAVVVESAPAFDETFVDRVKELFGVECTLFAGDTRASTTIIRDGKRFVGTKMDNAGSPDGADQGGNLPGPQSHRRTGLRHRVLAAP